MTYWNFDLKKIALVIKSQNKINKLIEYSAINKIHVWRSSNTEGINLKYLCSFLYI